MLRCIQTIEVAKEIFVRMTAQFSFCFICDSQLHCCIELQRLNGAVGDPKLEDQLVTSLVSSTSIQATLPQPYDVFRSCLQRQQNTE